MKASRGKQVKSVSLSWYQRPWSYFALLTLLVLLVYYPVLSFGFVNYDDDSYVFQNAMVQDGLSTAGLSWAFQTQFNGNWHPLLWLSFMLDSEVYGMQPGGFHATNVLLHIGAVLLLFAALQKMTGSLVRSFSVAVLFAAQPLGVEAVAWVSERKGTLSTFFWMLALYTYARYAREDSKRWLWLTALAILCGLLSKAMLVGLPLALLLLDLWPLGRWKPGASSAASEKLSEAAYGSKSLKQLLREKAPLFALVVIFSLIALQSQANYGALSTKAAVPAIERLGRVGVAYWIYLRKAALPWDLAANYAPPTESLSWALVVPAWLGLITVSVLAVKLSRRLPYFTVGWFWYLLTFLPVIGITPVGVQWMADRYAVIPMFGIYLAVVWGIADAIRAGKVPRLGATTVIALAGVAFVALAIRQVWFWQDSLTLFQRVVAIEPNNEIGHRSVGAAYGNLGEYDRAIEHFRKAIEIDPNYALALSDLGQALLAQDHPSEALSYLQRSLQVRPDDKVTLYQFALAHLKRGGYAAATEPLEQSLKIDSNQPNVHHDLGLVQAHLGNLDEAELHMRAALELQPNFAFAHGNLARMLANAGKLNEACEHYRMAIELAPNWPRPWEELVTILAVSNDPQVRDPVLALKLARQAESQFGATPQLLSALAAIQASQGDYPLAAKLAANGAALAEQHSLTTQAAEFRQDAEAYAAGKTVTRRIEFPWE